MIKVPNVIHNQTIAWKNQLAQLQNASMKSKSGISLLSPAAPVLPQSGCLLHQSAPVYGSGEHHLTSAGKDGLLSSLATPGQKPRLMPATFGALASLAVGPAIPIKLISIEAAVGTKV